MRWLTFTSGQGESMAAANDGLSRGQVASGTVITALITYSTAQGTYVAFKGNGAGCPMGQSGDLTAVPPPKPLEGKPFTPTPPPQPMPGTR